MEVKIEEHEPVKRQFDVSFVMDEDQLAELYMLVSSCNTYTPSGEWTYKLYQKLSEVLGPLKFDKVEVLAEEGIIQVKTKK